MRSRSVAVAITIAVLSSFGAVGCYVRATQLRTEGQWLLERGTAEAQEFANTFSGDAQDKQFATFEARREVLSRSVLWQRAQLLLILLTVIAAFSSYVLFLFSRLREDLEDIDDAELARLSIQTSTPPRPGHAPSH